MCYTKVDCYVDINARFTVQGAAEKSVAADYAQRNMNSLKSLQSIESAAIPQMEPLSSKNTWLEAVQDGVSSII